MSDITNSESSQFSEKAYVNKKLLLCYQIISAVLFIAYIIELVNDTRDKIFRRYTVTKDSTLLFPYLKEGDYSIRITQDLNANGRLDIGDVLAGKLPEKVRLYRLPGGEAIIKVGERMDIEQSVDLKELFNN